MEPETEKNQVDDQTQNAKDDTLLVVENFEDDSELDVAGRFLAEIAASADAEELLRPATKEEEGAVVRRIDLAVVPLLLAGQMMGGTDKVAIATAAVMGLKTDLKLTTNQYAWANSIVYFGQLALLFPCLFMMQRFPAGWVFSGCVLVWGIVSLATVACKNYSGLFACRFLLGFFESIAVPGASLIIGQFYTRSEMTLRMAIIYNTFSSVTNGFISYGCSFSKLHTLHPWQLLFLIIGLMSVVLSVLMFIFLPNSPTTALWLNRRQRVIAVNRLKDNRTGTKNQRFKFKQLKEALIDPKTWLCFLINIGLNIPNGGINSFGSIIVNQLGFNTQITALLSVPKGVINWMSSLILAFVVSKVRMRLIPTFLWTLIPFAATIVLSTVPRKNVGASLTSIYLVNTYWAPYVSIMTLVNANTAGYTKKTISYGICFIGYLVGNLVGPQTFKAKEAPEYKSAITAMLLSYSLVLALMVVYYFYMRWLVRRKAAYLESHPEEAQAHDLMDEWHDRTDFEDVRFQYVY